MSRSHDFSRNLPADLERSLAEALARDREVSILPRRPRGRFAPSVPQTVLVGELVRRGWSRREAEHWTEGRSHWASHERPGLRRAHFRGYRRGATVLISVGRSEELLPYRKTRGCLTW